MECPKCGIQNTASSSTCVCCGSELGELLGPDEQRPEGPVLVAGYGLSSLWRRLGAAISADGLVAAGARRG